MTLLRFREYIEYRNFGRYLKLEQYREQLLNSYCNYLTKMLSSMKMLDSFDNVSLEVKLNKEEYIDKDDFFEGK